jgi:hypothetical protein
MPVRLSIAEPFGNLAAADAEISQLVLAHGKKQGVVGPRATCVADQFQNDMEKRGLG